jgi:hypothetical protein
LPVISVYRAFVSFGAAQGRLSPPLCGGSERQDQNNPLRRLITYYPSY